MTVKPYKKTGSNLLLRKYYDKFVVGMGGEKE